MSSTKAHINPEVLRWAREEAGLSEAYLANKIQTKAEKILKWESGDEIPSMPQLRKLANFLKRPPALFFMSQPPELTPILTDFRRNSHDFPLSAQSRFMIRWAMNRREYAIELAEDLEEDIMEDYPILTLSNNPESIVSRIREFFMLEIDEQLKLKKVEDFLKYSIRKIEEKDILVFQTDRVDLAELRGFSISSRPYPVIVLNSDDSHAGRLFTLFHELGHILLQQDGICDLDYDEYDANNNISRLEVWNNRFSAAMLCPEEIFRKYSSQIIVDRRNIGIKQVEELSKVFLVSREAVARRLLQLGFTDKETYLAFREVFQRDWEKYKKSRKKNNKGKPVIIPQKYKIINWNGRKYTSLVIDALHNKNIGYYEASNYLGIKPKHLEPLARTLYRGEGL